VAPPADMQVTPGETPVEVVGLTRGDSIVVPYGFTVDRERRAALKAQRPKVLWLTGLSASGKSTLANRVERLLHDQGVHTYVLDGDNLRAGLSSDLGFTAEDRKENVRRVAEVAHLMYDAGLVVVVALVSPFRSDRQAARDLFPEGDFLEVWVDTPIDVCAERDPKGLYAKAASGRLANMTGRGQNYEEPESPDLVVHGIGDLDSSAALVVAAALGTDRTDG
jgi:bifunctional enzyme CysN/CysC